MTATVLRDDATLGASAHDDDGMGKPWTEDAVLRVLWRHFIAQSWAPVPQVTVAMRDLDDRANLSAWDRHRTQGRDDWTDRRIDMLLVRASKKHGIGPLETLAVEVKVTRADFLNDLKHPEKQAPWRKAAHRHAYVVPAGLVAKDEVPPGSGLIAVKHGPHGWGEVEWVKRVPYTPGHRPELPNRVHIALAHRLAQLEAATRGWTSGEQAEADPQALRAEAAAARKAAEKAEKAAATAQGKAEAWRTAHALAVGKGHPCRWCGEPTKPLNPGAGWFKRWRHVDAAADEPCEAAEAVAREAEARTEYDDADDTTRVQRFREAQRWSFSEHVEAEPWRAFLPPNHRNPGHPNVTGPEPADALPEGDPS